MFLSKYFQIAVSLCTKIYFYTVDNAVKRVYTIYRKNAPYFQKKEHTYELGRNL